jgi:hypothetical protein
MLPCTSLAVRSNFHQAKTPAGKQCYASFKSHPTGKRALASAGAENACAVA